MGECNDTVLLLKECNSGSKMAVTAIDEITEKLNDTKLMKLLLESKDHHTKLGNELHELLTRHHCDDEEPGAIAKGMSWLKTNVKMGMEDSIAAAAELMTDGCNMGIKSLYKYLHQYQAADSDSKDICSRLIRIEEQLRQDLAEYL